MPLISFSLSPSTDTSERGVVFSKFVQFIQESSVSIYFDSCGYRS